MRKIDTSPVTSTVDMPLRANAAVNAGIDFLTQALLDVSTALALAITQNANNPTLLAGCQLTGSTITAGWVFYAGEIYYVPAQTISGSGFNIAVTISKNPTDTSPNQTVMSDGTLVTVHNQNTIVLTYNSLPNTGALPDFQSWQAAGTSQSQWVNIASTPGYQNSWADKGAPYNLGRYRRIGSTVQLSGVIITPTLGSSTVAFQLPAEFSPANTVIFPAYCFAGNGEIAWVTIAASGICTISFIASTPFGTISLEGITFQVY